MNSAYPPLKSRPMPPITVATSFALLKFVILGASSTVPDGFYPEDAGKFDVRRLAETGELFGAVDAERF